MTDDIRSRQRALIERFNTFRDSGICSPTTRGLLDDAQCLLAEAVDEYLDAAKELRDRELHHFEAEQANTIALHELDRKLPTSRVDAMRVLKEAAR